MKLTERDHDLCVAALSLLQRISTSSPEFSRELLVLIDRFLSMKQVDDVYTIELPGFDSPRSSKAGRKPIGARAMTDAERKRRQREKEKASKRGLP